MERCLNVFSSDKYSYFIDDYSAFMYDHIFFLYRKTNSNLNFLLSNLILNWCNKDSNRLAACCHCYYLRCNIYCIYASIHHNHFCCNCTGWKFLVDTDVLFLHVLVAKHHIIFWYWEDVLIKPASAASFFPPFSCGLAYLIYVNQWEMTCQSTYFSLIHSSIP